MPNSLQLPPNIYNVNGRLSQSQCRSIHITSPALLASLATVTKLRGHNYHRWKQTILNIVSKTSFEDILLGRSIEPSIVIPFPEESDFASVTNRIAFIEDSRRRGEQAQDWIEMDKVLSQGILSTLDSSIDYYVQKHSRLPIDQPLSSRSLWIKLEYLYSNQSDIRYLISATTYDEITLSSSRDMEDYIKRMSDANVRTMLESGRICSKLGCTMQFLRGLGTEYEAWSRVVTNKFGMSELLLPLADADGNPMAGYTFTSQCGLAQLARCEALKRSICSSQIERAITNPRAQTAIFAPPITSRARMPSSQPRPIIRHSSFPIYPNSIGATNATDSTFNILHKQSHEGMHTVTGPIQPAESESLMHNPNSHFEVSLAREETRMPNMSTLESGVGHGMSIIPAQSNADYARRSKGTEQNAIEISDRESLDDCQTVSASTPQVPAATTEISLPTSIPSSRKTTHSSKTKLRRPKVPISKLLMTKPSTTKDTNQPQNKEKERALPGSGRTQRPRRLSSQPLAYVRVLRDEEDMLFGRQRG